MLPSRGRTKASNWKSSNTRRQNEGSCCCHVAGWWSARSAGWGAFGDLPETMNDWRKRSQAGIGWRPSCSYWLKLGSQVHNRLYIERDDQQWGGFGGIERVVLHRNSLTL